MRSIDGPLRRAPAKGLIADALIHHRQPEWTLLAIQVALAVADHMHRTRRRAFPSIATVAEAVGKSELHVKKALSLVCRAPDEHHEPRHIFVRSYRCLPVAGQRGGRKQAVYDLAPEFEALALERRPKVTPVGHLRSASESNLDGRPKVTPVGASNTCTTVEASNTRPDGALHKPDELPRPPDARATDACGAAALREVGSAPLRFRDERTSALTEEAGDGAPGLDPLTLEVLALNERLKHERRRRRRLRAGASLRAGSKPDGGLECESSDIYQRGA